MFHKVLAVCLVLYSVQVLGGSIKPKLSPEVQETVQQIDIKSLLLENAIKRSNFEKKQDADTAKANCKMALKRLKTVTKEAKGTLCGEIANMQIRGVELRSNDLKECTNKVNLKQLQQDLHGYLRNLHEEAMLVDRYCPFVHKNVDEATECITNSVAAMKSKLNDVETVITQGLDDHEADGTGCIKSVIDDVQMQAATIETEMNDCLNPPTEAPVEDDSSDSSESSDSSNSSESKGSSEESKSHEDSNEGGEEPGDNTTEGGNDGGEDNSEGTTEGSGNSEGGNDDDNTTHGKDEEGTTGDSDNNTTVDDSEGGTETEKPAEDGEETDAPAEGGDETEAPAEGGEETEAPSEGGDDGEEQTTKNADENTSGNGAIDTEEPAEDGNGNDEESKNDVEEGANDGEPQPNEDETSKNDANENLGENTIHQDEDEVNVEY